MTQDGVTDWDSLRIVLAIARSGGLSAAARRLGVTHATVSRHLDKAEAAMGVRLFSRRPSGLVPTEAGQEAVARAGAVEAEILALDLALCARDEAETGRLTIAAPPLIAAGDLAGDLADYARAHPGIDITLLASNDILDLHRRETDVALRVSRDPAGGLWGRIVVRQRAGWFATEGFIARHGEAIATGQGRVPIVAFRSWASPVPPSLAARLPGSVPVIACDDMVGAAAVAGTGLAMLRMPLFLSPANPMLVRVPGLELVDYMPLWCLTHPELRHLPRVAAFTGFIAARFAARRTLFEGPG